MSFVINPLVPELWCSDFQKSLNFYVDALGFEVAQRRAFDPHAYLSLQGSQIMIAHWDFDGSWEPWYPRPMERPYGRGVNFQFMVRRVQTLYDRVLAKGIRPFLEMRDSEIWRTDYMDTRRQFMVLDPDGYLLRFSETIGQRPLEEADTKEHTPAPRREAG